MTIIMTINIGIVTVVLAITNAAVFISASKRDKLFGRHHRKGAGAPGTVVTYRKMLRTSYICLAVVSSFLFCWLPYFIHNMMTLLGTYRPGGGKLFTLFVEQLALANSILDPLLFVLLTKEAKRIIKKTVESWLSRKVQVVPGE